MPFHVSYIVGETVREAVMSQRELDECRARCEIVEAVAVADACTEPSAEHMESAMTNSEAVKLWKKFLSAKAPMLIIPTPHDFGCTAPFVVVAKEMPLFVMGDFATVESALSFCQTNHLPVEVPGASRGAA